MTAQAVERIAPRHVRPSAYHHSSGALDGYWHGVVESYNPADGKPIETLGTCAHRHPLARTAMACGLRMVRARAARAAAKARP